MKSATNGQIATVPANGQPTTLLETVEHEARAYRAWGTPIGAFLASQMERLGQLIRWTGATDPVEHDDRMEVWDRSIRADCFDRGFAAGYEAARSELGLSLDDRR